MISARKARDNVFNDYLFTILSVVCRGEATDYLRDTTLFFVTYGIILKGVRILVVISQVQPGKFRTQ